LSVTLIDGSKSTVSSDAEFQAIITASLQTKAIIGTALENSKNGIHSVNGTFKEFVFLNGVETEVTWYYFIDFANDMSIKVLNGVAT
jgi:hypothetical protein